MPKFISLRQINSSAIYKAAIDKITHIRHDGGAVTEVFFGSTAIFVRDTPTEIENLIRKATENA